MKTVLIFAVLTSHVRFSRVLFSVAEFCRETSLGDSRTRHNSSQENIFQNIFFLPSFSSFRLKIAISIISPLPAAKCLCLLHALRAFL